MTDTLEGPFRAVAKCGKCNTILAHGTPPIVDAIVVQPCPICMLAQHKESYAAGRISAMIDLQRLEQ